MVKKKKTTTKKVAKPKAPEEIAANEIFQLLAQYPSIPTTENVALSGAFKTIRNCEMARDSTIQSELLGIARANKDKFLKMLLQDILKSPNLRILDILIIMEAICNEMKLLPVWDYEHVAATDDAKLKAGVYGDIPDIDKYMNMMVNAGEEMGEDKDEKHNTRDMFNAIGNSALPVNECDCSD